MILMLAEFTSTLPPELRHGVERKDEDASLLNPQVYKELSLQLNSPE